MAHSESFAKSAWVLASIVVVVAVLYLAKAVLVPLTLAVLLSFLLSPVCDWLEQRSFGRIPAVLVTAVLGFSLLGIVTWLAVVQMTALAPKVPEYETNLRAKLHSVNNYFVEALSKFTETTEDIGQSLPQSQQAEPPQGTDERPYSVRVLSTPASPLQVLSGTFGTLVEFLGLAGVVIILVVFFLVRREDLRDRFIRLVGTSQVTMTTQMLEDAATRVSRYLSTLFVINATYGIAVGIGLYLIGVPNAILWGILATTLRFVPYIGPWIAAAMPVGLSLAISTGWVAPILTVVLFVALELFSNNIMEPWLYGKNTGMSAVAVLLAAVFWTWLWGIAGLLLATPLTVCLLVIGKHVPQLSFLEVLLGSEPVFKPHRRVYQRLLAGDQEEATELVDYELLNKPMAEVYDKLLIPALALAETDWHRGELDERRHQFILQSLKEMIRDRCPLPQATQPTKDLRDSTSKRPFILCLPARNEADEIAAMMLAQLLTTSDFLAESVSFTTDANELTRIFEAHKPSVVCISATPPAAVMHARHLCEQLRGSFPEFPLLVGLWNADFDLAKAKERIGRVATTHVVPTLAEAQAQVVALVQHVSPRPEQQLQADSDTAIVAARRSLIGM